MKITVTKISTSETVEVRRAGVLEGQIMLFQNSLQLARTIDRLALRGQRIPVIGATA